MAERPPALPAEEEEEKTDNEWQRRMGLTLGEFSRQLRYALDGCNWRWEEEGVASVRWPEGGTTRIAVRPCHPLDLGALRLPMADVSVSFTGCSRRRIRRFLDRFGLAFHRGGG